MKITKGQITKAWFWLILVVATWFNVNWALDWLNAPSTALVLAAIVDLLLAATIWVLLIINLVIGKHKPQPPFDTSSL